MFARSSRRRTPDRAGERAPRSRGEPGHAARSGQQGREHLATRVRDAYREEVDHTHQSLFNAAVAFTLTFAGLRGLTYALRYDLLPWGDIVTGGVHLHHYVWGVGLLLVVGMVSLIVDSPRYNPLLGVLYGIGTALVVDEFALLLNLRDVYWTKEGRISVDTALCTIAVAAVYFTAKAFWQRLGHELVRWIRGVRSQNGPSAARPAAVRRPNSPLPVAGRDNRCMPSTRTDPGGELAVRPGPGVPQGLVLPAADLVERFSRSSGPGGQGVNTTDSRAELRFDVFRSAGLRTLSEAQRDRAVSGLAPRMVGDEVIIVASEHRSQRQNRVAARERLAALLREALAPPPPARRRTKPSRGAQQRRLTAKKQRGVTKAGRGRVTGE